MSAADKYSIPTVQQIEEAVGMGAAGWDMIDPNSIIDAVIRLAAPTQGADARPVAITVPMPTERGIYAWIADGSASLVLVHTRPSDHSPGGVMKATNIRNCTFYEGCPVEQWHGGTWYGPLTKDATRDAAPSLPTASQIYTAIEGVAATRTSPENICDVLAIINRLQGAPMERT